MFDTVQGLPVHALVLHAAVVLVPVMAVLNVLISVVGRLRARWAWPVMAGNVAAVLAVFVAIQSGEALQRRLQPNPQIEAHAALGEAMLPFTLAMLAVSVLAAVLRRRAGVVRVAVGVLSVVAALAATIWVVRVGHSGATAVWKDVITATNPAAG